MNLKAAVLALPLSLGITACGDEASLATVPDRSFAFAAFGDAPYAGDDLMRVQRVIEELNEASLEWVINVGDILFYPCSDDMFRSRHALFRTIRHPVVLTPGDNDWTDCHGRREGRYEPLERLQALRTVFFPETGHAIGGKALRTESQGGEFPENLLWVHQGVVFATVHVVGSHNGRNPFASRTQADDAEADRRETAAIQWLEQTFRQAEERGARAIVLAWHAAPAFDREPGHAWRVGFEDILAALEIQVAAWGRPVMLLHGDDHRYLVDHPLTNRRDGQPLENFTRVEVMGTPRIGWVRVVVDPAASQPFHVESHYVGRGWWYFRRLFGGD